MTISHGADVEALRLLADEMLTHSEVCLRVALRTTAALADLSWRGPDADRARAAWASTHEPHLRETSRLVAGAARHVIDQAREQEDASSVGAGGPPPAGPSPTGPAPAGSAPAGGATGRGTGWRGMLDRAMALAGTTATSHDLARTIGILVEEGIDLGAGGFASAEAALDAASPALRQVGRLASALGVAADAHGLLRGIEQGDYSQIVGSGGGLAIAGAGALGMGAAGPVGVAWGLGHEAGTAIYDGMQGTTYGDIVRDMSDEAFRENGAWGMVQVPGILGFAAWERWVSGRHGDAGGGR